MFRRELAHEASGIVARAVVHHHYLGAPFLLAQMSQHLLQRSANARALVISRYNNAVLRLGRLQTRIRQGKLYRQAHAACSFFLSIKKNSSTKFGSYNRWSVLSIIGPLSSSLV